MTDFFAILIISTKKSSKTSLPTGRAHFRMLAVKNIKVNENKALFRTLKQVPDKNDKKEGGVN